MINTAQFRIIGRIGSINNLEKVTHLSIASDRRTKDDNGKWITSANWNSVTIFSKKLRKRLEDEAVARHGNLVAIEGYVQSNSYENDDEKTYDTSLVVQNFEILSFAKQL